MHILALNASYRGDRGHTRFLIDRLFQGAREAGATCEVVTLAKLKINRCLACDQCHTPASYLHCVYEHKDDVWGVFQKMAAADIIVYATPVYLFGVSGLLKLFLERFYGTADVNALQITESGLLFHHRNRAVCSKPFVTLVCCDNIEAEIPRSAVQYFRTFARFMDAPQVGELVRNGGQLCGHGHDPLRSRWLPKLPAIYAAFEQAGRELATQGHISKRTQRRASQEVIPVPCFGLIKRIPFRWFKQRLAAMAQQMQHEIAAAVPATR